MNIVINGFGRIGRTFLRTIMADEAAKKKLNVVAINIGPARIEHVAHLFKYDSVMGAYPGEVELIGNVLNVDGNAIKLLAELDAQKLPWKQLNVDWVVECTGKFTKRELASQHLTAGARAVLISAPATDEDVSIVPGVNDAVFDKNNHKIVSLGSCTTNALVTMLKVVHDAFAIERAFMTTVHAYTPSQMLLDNDEKDLRRARAAAINIIPTSTGAQKVVGKVMPELDGLVQAMALRVPVPKVSLIDLVVHTKKAVTRDAINQAYERAARERMRGILAITYEPLVSSDFSGNPHSSIVDGLLTAVHGEHAAKIFGWYDNEWGYSCRLRDFLTRDA